MSAYRRTLDVDGVEVTFRITKGPPPVPMPPDYHAAEAPTRVLRGRAGGEAHVLESPARHSSLQDYDDATLAAAWRMAAAADRPGAS